MLSSSGRKDRRRTGRESAAITAGMGLDMLGRGAVLLLTDKLARSDALDAKLQL
jgi:hypothetical protein